MKQMYLQRAAPYISFRTVFDKELQEKQNDPLEFIAKGVILSIP